MIQCAKHEEGKESSVEIIENPVNSGIENPVNMVNTLESNDEICHVAGSSSYSSVGENRVVNRFLNNGDVEHATVPSIVSENRSIVQKRKLGVMNMP